MVLSPSHVGSFVVVVIHVNIVVHVVPIIISSPNGHKIVKYGVTMFSFSFSLGWWWYHHYCCCPIMASI
jgi:hypothetical protein